MMVASKSRAKIMPKAMYFIMTMSENPNAPHTTIMIMAAALIIPPVWAVPNLMATSVAARCSRASTMRDTRNTS